MRQTTTSRRRPAAARPAARLPVAFLVVCLAAIPDSRADPPQRARWDPIAAAYLYGAFALSLEPVDWTGIADRFATTSAVFAHNADRSVYDRLGAASAFAGVDLAAEIRAAVAARDAARFRAASTRAVAAAIRLRLFRAGARLGEAGKARRETRRARALFAAFADRLREVDPEGSRRLGLAWLELATAAADRDAARARRRFAPAAAVVADYLVERFEARTPDLARRAAPWLPPDAEIGEQDPLPRLVLNAEERGIDEADLFLVAYGDMLFDSPEIFGEPARSLGFACSSCHNRSEANRGFYLPGLSRRRGGVDVDGGLFNPRANDHRFDPLDIPSLRGIRFTAPYGRDGRFASLRAFVRNVIVNEFAGSEPTPLMLDAMIAYLNEFDFLPAPFLYRNGRLNARASAAAKRGERLFHRPFPGMGGLSCASCHLPTANFLDGRRHDIGSGDPSSAHARDSAFDTPTLLGIAHTAPYFHDGSLETLADAVDWFNARFGLGLDAGGKADLTAYLEAVGTGADPYETFDGENTRFRLAFDELSVFLSTLDALIPARDAFHAQLLIRTAARELRAEAQAMSNVRRMELADALAGRIEAIGTAIAAGDWDAAARLRAAYRTAERDHAAEMY